MIYFDFHVHIDHYPDPVKIANEYESSKTYALFVTNLPEIFEMHMNVFSNYTYVRLALGYHPFLTEEIPLNRDLFDKLSDKTKYIGEVGIDINGGNLQKQIDNLRFVTQKKYNRNRIYSIHSRGAEDAVLEVLIENDVKHVVFHWYSGKISTLKRLISRNYLFSINGNMLKSKKGINIIKNIPKELLLFETDGPFLRYNNKVVTPQHIPELVQLFDSHIRDFANISYKNFKRMLFIRSFYD